AADLPKIERQYRASAPQDFAFGCHEAGHTVYAFSLASEISFASLLSNRRIGGRVWHSLRCASRQEQMVLSLTGPIAESVIGGRKLNMRFAPNSDREKVDSILLEVEPHHYPGDEIGGTRAGHEAMEL